MKKTFLNKIINQFGVLIGIQFWDGALNVATLLIRNLNARARMEK
jgi:hypothetical protein